MYQHESKKPVKEITDMRKLLSAQVGMNSETIFVSIISYRDSEVGRTLESLFTQAERPGQVWVGLVLQHDAAEEEAQGWFRYQGAHLGQITTLRLDWQQAKGPCFARALAQTLWRGERFLLQIDSHMRFSRGWDRDLRHMWAQCRRRSQRPVLTTYPLGYELGQPAPTAREPNLLCAKAFDALDGMLRITGKTLAACPAEPIQGLFWAAGFHFSEAWVMAEVPYDPNLKDLFFGEESAMAARLYTHGWDFFVPTHNVVYHLWSRAHRPSFRDKPLPPQEHGLEEASARRVRLLLQQELLAASEQKQQTDLVGSEQEQQQAQQVSRREAVSVGTPAAAPAESSSGSCESPTSTLNANSVSATCTTPSSYKPSAASSGAAGARNLSEDSQWAEVEDGEERDGTGGGQLGLQQLGAYGLGTQRTLAQYEAFCGVQFKERKITQRARQGGVAAAIFKADAAVSQLLALLGTHKFV
eukprot:g66010.t1